MTPNELVTVLALGAFAVLLAAVWQVDMRRKKRGSYRAMSGVMGTFDEVFHPEAARATEIREIQQELPADAPAPGEPLRPGDSITIAFPVDQPSFPPSST